jgi:hypothetical protein
MSDEYSNVELDGIIGDILDKQDTSAATTRVLKKERKEYPALYVFSNVYKYMGWIALVLIGLSVIVGTIKLIQVDFWTGLEFFIKFSLVGAFIFITALAAAEAIKIFIRLEQNTRKQTELLEKLLQKK